MSSNTNDESDCNSLKSKVDYSSHWNAVYTNNPIKKLGWYEDNPDKTLSLIEECNLEKDANIFIPGAGSTTLIDHLIHKNYKNIIANDLSESALNSLKMRINKIGAVTYIVDDLMHPQYLKSIKNVDLWVDRAVLHFFTEPEEQNTYFNLLRMMLKKNGFVILAAFNLKGAKKCSGLDVCNYNAASLSDRLGDEFQLLKSFDYIYLTPSGATKPYVYTLFQRQ